MDQFPLEYVDPCSCVLPALILILMALIENRRREEFAYYMTLDVQEPYLTLENFTSFEKIPASEWGKDQLWEKGQLDDDLWDSSAMEYGLW